MVISGGGENDALLKTIGEHQGTVDLAVVDDSKCAPR